jgi:hypothetical protein
MPRASLALALVACPPDEVLRDLAHGNTGVAADLSRHLESCDDCVARVAALADSCPTLDGPRLAPGARLGRYRIVDLLGSGGMAEVYEAIDTELERGVALKVVRSDLARDVLEHRLRRESKLMARTRHPSVMTVYDVGVADGEVYVAMELIRGGTVRDWLEGGPRSLREILDVYRRAGDGLAAAHRAGLVHRDFKPDNVLVETSGGRVERVLVTDFGVARAMYGAHEPAARGRPSTVEATVAGALIGTPAYMAPEQLDGSVVDTRADVFAFAASVWEALYGTRPFPGITVPEIVTAMESPPAVDPSRAKTTDPIPPQIQRTLRAALALRAADRTQTVGEVVAGLVVPGPKRRRWGRVLALAAMPVALVVSGLIARVAAANDPCDAPSRLDELTAAVGRATWARSMPSWYDVGTYPSRWSALRGRACAADRDDVRPVLACLDAERAWTIVTLDGLTAASEDDRRAALGELTPPSPPAECLSAAAGVHTEHPPAGEDGSRRAGALLVALGRVHASIVTGQLEMALERPRETFDRATAELVALAPEVDAARNPILTARRDLVAALLADAGPTYKSEVRDLAIRLYANGQPREAAAAWLAHLERLTASGLYPRVLDLLPAAEQSLHAAGDPPPLVARWWTLRAIALAFDAETDAARASMAAADELRASGAASPLDAIALRCQYFEETADDATAVACTRDALEAVAAVTGTGAPRAALVTVDLGRRLALAGHHDDAIELLSALLRTRDRLTTILDARLVCELIVAFTAHDRAADAVALYVAHQPLLGELADAVCVSAAASAHRARGNTEAAYETAQVAYDLDLMAPAPNVYVRIRVADLALDAGRASEAEGASRAVLSITEAGGPSTAPAALEILARAIHGRALAKLGRGKEAIADLERVVAPPGPDETAEDSEELAPVRARAALALAALLPAGERGRARALVTDAIALLEASPVEWRVDLAVAKVWLAKHP